MTGRNREGFMVTVWLRKLKSGPQCNIVTATTMPRLESSVSCTILANEIKAKHEAHYRFTSIRI